MVPEVRCSSRHFSRGRRGAEPIASRFGVGRRHDGTLLQSSRWPMLAE
jgi:hypothetical protein